MNILITAIGSMSATCAITSLKSKNHVVIGCDIYPKDWHYESSLCDSFYQVSLCTDESNYCQELLTIIDDNDIDLLIPLTDLEIDVLNKHRNLFNNVIICTQTNDVLYYTRNKYNLYNLFKNDINVPSIKTYLLSEYNNFINKPIIVKKINGRSSEGIIYNATINQLNLINDKSQYIVQQQLQGNIFTVDYCRHALSKTDVCLPREELLRTKNGAGLTVKACNDPILLNLTSYIGNILNINGVVCMEFIKSNNTYYLIDINPRFSAGIAFSMKQNYDIVNNHIACFISNNIDLQVNIKEQILIKTYFEI